MLSDAFSSSFFFVYEKICSSIFVFVYEIVLMSLPVLFSARIQCLLSTPVV